jgi:HD superfamily phosphohydrolase
VHNPESGIDTDKMDYLLRDVASFGLKFMYDPLRIIRNCRVIDNRICFCDRVCDEISSLFHIRHKMYRFIYLHPTIQKFDQCFFNIIMSDPDVVTYIRSAMQDKNGIRFTRMTDSWLLQMMNQDMFDKAMSRQWSFFQPFSLREFHDRQFGLLKNVHFFYRKQPETSFTMDADRFQDIGHIHRNPVSCPEHHRNHDTHDAQYYQSLPAYLDNSEKGTQTLYHP